MITIVSGLPRSGTSLMMQILEAGEMDILTDNVRQADENNLRGYYEYEKVKSLQKDNTWLKDAEGKAVKVIAQLIPYLPDNYEYNFIFMERDIDEILISQNKMISNLKGKQSTVSIEVLKKTFEAQLNKVKYLLSNHTNIVYVNYYSLLHNGEEVINHINDKLDLNLNVNKASQVIDYNLYRSKK